MHLRGVWRSPSSRPEINKRIVRALVEEVLVDETVPGKLSFIVHCKGGTRTPCEMDRPRSAVGGSNAVADVELISGWPFDTEMPSLGGAQPWWPPHWQGQPLDAGPDRVGSQATRHRRSAEDEAPSRHADHERGGSLLSGIGISIGGVELTRGAVRVRSRPVCLCHGLTGRPRSGSSGRLEGRGPRGRASLRAPSHGRGGRAGGGAASGW